MVCLQVWAEMSVERASNKSVRFTALDADGQPKIFLAMVGSECHLIDYRCILLSCILLPTSLIFYLLSNNFSERIAYQLWIVVAGKP